MHRVHSADEDSLLRIAPHKNLVMRLAKRKLGLIIPQLVVVNFLTAASLAVQPKWMLCASIKLGFDL